MTTVTFTSSGSWTVPAGVSTADVQCWGEGGNGGVGKAGTGSHSGGGGGGGEFAEEPNLAVSGTISFTIGAGGTSTNTTFPGTSVTVTAHFGGNAVSTTAGAAGTGSTNTTHFNGGTGGSGGTGSFFGGGGGGSSAGTAAVGGNGGNGGASPGTGGTAPAGGGNGGVGAGSGGSAAGNGSVPGGGGGGASTHSGSIAGNGATGQVVINYTANVAGTATLTGVGTLSAIASVFTQGSFPQQITSPGRSWLNRFGHGRDHIVMPGRQAQTITGTASLTGVGTMSALGGTPAPAVINQWAASYGQGTTFTSITSALQSCVVPLTPGNSVGPGSGTPTQGNWLFTVASWTQNPLISKVHIGVGDDIHSFWREYPASLATGNSRTSISYTPNIARTVGNVYVAPDMEIAAINVLVVEVAGLGPWDTVVSGGPVTGYTPAGTSLNLALGAPSAASFWIAGIGGDNISAGQAFAPAGWTTLATQTQTNGANNLADNQLNAAYRASSALSQSVTATSTSAEDISGFMIGVLTAASSPIPASNNPNWPYTIVEAGFGAGFNTPDSEVTWTDITSRVWSVDETTGIQFQLSSLQATNMHLELDNNDNALSSDNVGSPYYSNALNPNMSFQSGISGWAGNDNATIAQSSDFAFSSSINGQPAFSLKVTPDGVTSFPGAAATRQAVTASATYTASCWLYSPAGWASGGSIGFLWFDSGGGFISFSSFSTTALPAATWTQTSVTVTAPSNAATGQLLVQLTGTPSHSAPFYVAEAAFVAGSNVVSTGLVTSGTPIRIRMALGTMGGVSVNRWYILQRYAMEWGEALTDVFRRYCPVTATDIWSSLSATPPTFYRSEIYQDAPYAWWPLDDPPGPAGVLPKTMLNAAVGNTNVLNVQLSPNGTGPTTSFGTDGSSLTFATTVAKQPGIAVYGVGTNSGWMFGDPPGQPASLATGNSVSPSPGSASWQQIGATGNSGSFGWFLTCNDTNFPTLANGITVEGWFNYQYFGTQTVVQSSGSHVLAQQPYCPLTLIELATNSAPVAVLQMDINGALNLITYNGGTGTSHSIYNGSDLRGSSWFMVSMTLTQNTWTVWVNGGATAQVSGSGAGMTSAWTWLIVNGDLGSGGGSSLGNIAHGGNAAISHIAVYPYVLPYYRIMDHYWAAITAFGQLPAPLTAAITFQDTSGSPAATPDGQLATGSYGTNTQPVTASGVIVAQVAGITSGPSAWTVSGAVGPSSILAGDSMSITWQGLAPQFAVYTATSVGNEAQASVVTSLSEDYSSGYGAGAHGYGVGHFSGGNGSSAPTASLIGDSVGERIERLMRAGRCTSPNRCIDPSPLLVQAPGTAGGATQTSDAIQAMQQSDSGLLYVDNCGHVTYWQRTHLASQYTSPVWNIGPSTGKIPYYRGIEWLTDPQRVWNAITVSPFSPTGNQLPLVTPSNASAVTASQVRYGAQPLSITSWLQDRSEMQNQANWLFQFFGQSQRRAERVLIDAAAYPAAWPLVAGINVGDVITLEDWVVGGGGAVVTMRVTEINRRISFGARDQDVTAHVELTCDFEPTSYWS